MRRAWNRFHLFAQCTNMHIDGATIAEIGEAPDLVQQRLPRKHAVRGRGQRHQQIEFLDRQGDTLAVDLDAASWDVDDETVKTQYLTLYRVCLRANCDGADSTLAFGCCTALPGTA